MNEKSKAIRLASIAILATVKDIGKAIHSHNVEILKHIFSEGNGDFTEATFFVTKLRNAESLNDYYAKRIAELRGSQP